MHPVRLAAGFGDRSDAGELLEFFGALVAVAVGAEGRTQARAQRRSGARQAVKEFPVGVLAEESSQGLIKTL